MSLLYGSTSGVIVEEMKVGKNWWEESLDFL